MAQKWQVSLNKSQLAQVGVSGLFSYHHLSGLTVLSHEESSTYVPLQFKFFSQVLSADNVAALPITSESSFINLLCFLRLAADVTSLDSLLTILTSELLVGSVLTVPEGWSETESKSKLQFFLHC